VRLDSPAVLSTAGAVAIHVLLAVAGDALVVTMPRPHPEEAPRVELVDILPDLETPVPPPVTEQVKQPDPVPEEKAPEPKVQPVRQRVARTTTPPPAETEPPPPTQPTSDNSGGAPVTTMENIAPSATGVAVAKGPRRNGTGRGGIGTGTGSGVGAGSSDEAPRPMSIATIKKRAMPKGDFSYFDASKDYPPEAKSLGIEGVIRVRLVVDDTGAVKSAVLLNKLGHGLDELAMIRAKQIKFDPALDTDDKPVSSVVVWTFNMTLPK